MLLATGVTAGVVVVNLGNKAQGTGVADEDSEGTVTLVSVGEGGGVEFFAR